KPVLKSFRIEVNYPAYIGRKNETRTSLGDMTLPAGTTLNWTLLTEHTDEASIRLGTGVAIPLEQNNSKFSYRYRFLNDTFYTVTLHNRESSVADSYHYQVQIIPDQYPVIQLQQVKDTINGTQVLITGTAGDDYGITRASFNYEVTENNKTIAKKTTPLPTQAGVLCSFKQFFDIEGLHLKPGQKVAYFVEAWDNDGVHGSKATRSETMSFQAFDEHQLDSAINENSQQINSGLSNSSQTSKDLQNQFKEMQTQMLQTENMDWQQQQNMQEMMKKQTDLQNQMEQVKQRFEEQMQQSEQKQYSDEVKEKQKDIQQQLDNLLNAELKEQMKKLQEMMEKMNREQAMEAMKKMAQENKLFSMDMDRMKSLMNQLEQQMRMEDLAAKAGDLARKEDSLNKLTDQGQKSNAELKDAQEKIKDELEKAMKDQMKAIQDLAKQNKQDKGLDEMKAKADSAAQEMGKSEDDLQK
ncbi:MAG: hypothetical protein EBZ77_15525, partial [Chitinophagia bacterium]|nr:hypothetical protein [Chitinophagia bacterium]